MACANIQPYYGFLLKIVKKLLRGLKWKSYIVYKNLSASHMKAYGRHA
jgi:hypothetical protein